jgi:Ca-activated chloride channel family protein
MLVLGSRLYRVNRRRHAQHRHRRDPGRRQITPLVVVAATVVLAFGLVGWAGHWWLAARSGNASGAPGSLPGAEAFFPADALPAAAGVRPCTVVRVLGSFENRPLLGALVDAYRGLERNVAGHCVRVEVSVQRSGLAAQDAASGFGRLSAGDRPSIWAPDSSAWLGLARRAAAQGSRTVVVPAGAPAIAHTPIVLAMAQPQATAAGWQRQPPSWREYLAAASEDDFWARHAHPEWGAFRMGRTSPQAASSGLYGLVAEYATVAGHPDVLGAAEVASPGVRGRVRQAELAIVHYMASEEHFFWHVRQAEDSGDVRGYVSAVTADEKAVWDYNRGTVSKDGVTAQRLAPPHLRLVPIYPRDGTFFVDSPLAVLGGPWVDARQRAAAADFVRFARTRQGQAVVRANGYRDVRGRCDAQVAATGGYGDITSVAAFSEPAPDVLAAVEASFIQVRKRARVLFVLDLSSSMNDPIGSGQTRLQAAEDAIIAALPNFAPDDQVGLAAFSNTSHSGAITPGTLSPVSPLGAKQSDLVAKIRGLRVVGQTPLYAAVREYSASMAGPGYDPNKINAVVLLTDGHNDTDDPTTQAQMTAALTGLEQQKHDVLVFTLAYAGGADKPVLEEISKLTHAHYYDASDPRQVTQVLGDLVTSF